jgi:hypothetical protein
MPGRQKSSEMQELFLLPGIMVATNSGFVRL